VANRRSRLLRPAQGRYLSTLQPARDALAQAIEGRAAREDRLLPAPEVARFVGGLAAREPAARMLELDCALGYLTLHLLRGAPQGSVLATESDPEALAAVAEMLTAAGLVERCELLAGEALELLAGLSGPFDLVVFDARRGEPRRTLDLALPLLRVGGTLIAVGLLGDGEVADPALRGGDAALAERLERFNPYWMIHPQLAASLLPLGSGVGMAIKRRPTMRELGGPF